MNNRNQTSSRIIHSANPLLTITLLTLCFGCRKSDIQNNDLGGFKQVNLVANSAEYKPVTVDPTLLNAFGMAWSPNGTAWVNSVGGHVAELYNAEGAIVRTPVNIPSPTDTIGGLPCGIVFSANKGFNLSNGPSVFLFTGFDGVLSGWNNASGDNAKSLRNPANASYTGLAIANNSGRNLIYGANFGANKIDVWDTAFSRVTMSFKDPQLPTDYSPYNIQAIGDWLFVMYGKLGTDGHPVLGAGNGIVSVFNTDGSFVKRLATGGSLNVPWGITLASGAFLKDQDIDKDGKNNDGESSDKGYGTGSGNYGNHDSKDAVILIGNFGDGRINVYGQDAKYLGQLRSHNRTIAIDGLWALSFAPSTATAIDPGRLYFTAGPDHEADGLFGYLIKQ